MTQTIPSAAGLDITDTTVTDEYTIGCISTLNTSGDTPTMWDTRNPAEVEAARRVFAQATASGKLAFKTTSKDPNTGDQIREFEPTAERIVVMNPLQGG